MTEATEALKRGRKGSYVMDTKKKIYVLVLIWAAVFVQILITKGINRESRMVAQVMSDGIENVTAAEVKLYAAYGEESMDAGKRETLVKKLGGKLGITSGYEVVQKEDGDAASTALVKKGANGDTTIRLISMQETSADGKDRQENYLMTELVLKNQSTEDIYSCKEMLEQLYEGLGMEASSNIYLCSQEKGRMTEEEIEQATQDFLSTMHAKKRKTIELDNTSCIYGYSDNINEYVYQDDERVNVNIAFSYDEDEDITYIHRAIPFIDKSF